MTTLKQVALLAGTSITTTSRALRGDRRILPDTKERIFNAATALGYQRNSHVGSMMAALRRRTSGAFHGNLALLWPEERAYWKTDRSIREMRAAILRRTGELNFSIDEFSLSAQPPEALHAILKNRGIRGVIVSAPSSLARALTTSFDFTGFACTAIGSGLTSPKMDSVLFDTYAAMRLAIEHTKFQFDAGIAALWDTASEESTFQAARSAFLVFHPAGPVEAAELFWDYHTIKAPTVRRLIQSRAIKSVICFPGMPLPPWMKGLIAPENCVWFNHPPKRARFGSIDMNNQATGFLAVDVLAGKLFEHQLGLPDTPVRTLVAPSWKEVSK